MVKFNKSINEYDYVLSFDLAKHNTGYSLYSLSDKTVILTGMIIAQPPIYCKQNFNFRKRTDKKIFRFFAYFTKNIR